MPGETVKVAAWEIISSVIYSVGVDLEVCVSGAVGRRFKRNYDKKRTRITDYSLF